MKNRISFYILYKDFNNGEMTHYDVMPTLYNTIFNSDNTISKQRFKIYSKILKDYKPIETIEELKKFITNHFRYHYWSKCEWEFIASDWPPGKDERRKKIDGFQQLEPNIDLITEIIWKQIFKKIR
ncbi:MAG: hypothetical protein K2H20_01010 [Bacilli bacterium]|nr:hypothetical protein [Bacilli bacterium]